jgi:hypothetical protein
MRFEFHEAEERSMRLDGLSWSLGSLNWPSPTPPLMAERAEMVSRIIPDWAIAAAHTAGWVYTGLGRAEPWALICRRGPAISPLVRREWKPRSFTVSDSDLRTVRGLTLTSRQRTLQDLLRWPGDDELAACQLYDLADSDTLEAATAEALKHSRTARTSHTIRVRVALTKKWWDSYPFVTR